MDIAQFKQLPFIGIVRGVDANGLEPLAEAVIAGGLKTMEITMNTAGAPGLIRKLVKKAGKDLTVGAGTVLSVDDLKTAIDAGATFIVMPVLVPDVCSWCVKKHIPVFPGAFSPQEIYDAWQAGATMVKVFPTKFLSPEYFREIKLPLQDVELMACGGVYPDNVRAFFEAGASAIAFGGSVFKREWMTKKEAFRITEAVKALLKEYHK
ncbi:MAG: bifunctional 4-hydroxy-2-oxoglutarate aldolase/2-dehydro-3-deoxy-phosphogluconate aldolase [Candidatus Omnitrophica bacterium]|nr:bifunctional 4-hydroxy-2-oxoglutarate aldolase/2-dehydro-3-deoxy-phosphogluconate aldolase [Candidatus Omnitrophota bacterium]